MSYAYRPGAASTIHRVFVGGSSTTFTSRQPSLAGQLSGVPGRTDRRPLAESYPQNHQTKTQNGEIPAGGLTVSVNQALEIVTSQPVTKVKVRSIGQALEADSGRVASAVRIKAVGQAPEVDSAGPTFAHLVVSVNQAFEIVSAQALTGLKMWPVGRATEVDSGQVVNASRIRAIGSALEVDASGPTFAQDPLPQILETNTAKPITRLKFLVLNDTFTSSFTFLYGQL